MTPLSISSINASRPVVASREDARAYRVGLAGDRVIEAPLRPALLNRAVPRAVDTRNDPIGVRPELAAAQ